MEREPFTRHRRLPVGAGSLSAIEILVLGPLAAFLVLWAIPSAFEIEWACIGKYGIERASGDSYAAGFGVAGTFGWLLVLVAAIFSSIAGARRVAALVPLAWFLVLVAGALTAAALIGPQLCTT